VCPTSMVAFVERFVVGEKGDAFWYEGTRLMILPSV
jgi:hypothetical protein